ncbi:sulfite exporter TauE/SafE family protein [Litoreibacter roseus]|uniref:Probable membrane transporter protein n=1 Tax=Litoreibacter roseus TaxID=2601869 RepID=A0A6N6JHK3_9RHOB|nr:sulfite exporter TauE/SafE family protein [Litoreibacter roseus]GFE64859.1 membrane protein [Litoreibacter roseus]
MDTNVLLVAGGAFLLAGLVKGVAGMGLPTAAIGLMTLMLDPRTAISLIFFPMIGSNAWQIYRSGELIRTVKTYRIFAIALFFAVIVTSILTRSAGDQTLLAALGGVILLFVAVSWWGWVPRLPDRYDSAAQLGFGLFGGVIGGMTVGWAAPLAIYLTTRGVDKDEFVRATGFLIFVGSLPLCAAYVQLGFLTGPLAGISIAMLVPTLIGFSLGEVLRGKMSVTVFRNTILLVFTALALNLLRRAFF